MNRKYMENEEEESEQERTLMQVKHHNLFTSVCWFVEAEMMVLASS